MRQGNLNATQHSDFKTFSLTIVGAIFVSATYTQMTMQITSYNPLILKSYS